MNRSEWTGNVVLFFNSLLGMVRNRERAGGGRYESDAQLDYFIDKLNARALL